MPGSQQDTDWTRLPQQQPVTSVLVYSRDTAQHAQQQQQGAGLQSTGHAATTTTGQAAAAVGVTSPEDNITEVPATSQHQHGRSLALEAGQDATGPNAGTGAEGRSGDGRPAPLSLDLLRAPSHVMDFQPVAWTIGTESPRAESGGGAQVPRRQSRPHRMHRRAQSAWDGSAARVAQHHSGPSSIQGAATYRLQGEAQQAQDIVFAQGGAPVTIHSTGISASPFEAAGFSVSPGTHAAIVDGGSNTPLPALTGAAASAVLSPTGSVVENASPLCSTPTAVQQAAWSNLMYALPSIQTQQQPLSAPLHSADMLYSHGPLLPGSSSVGPSTVSVALPQPPQQPSSLGLLHATTSEVVSHHTVISIPAPADSINSESVLPPADLVAHDALTANMQQGSSADAANREPSLAMGLGLNTDQTHVSPQAMHQEVVASSAPATTQVTAAVQPAANTEHAAPQGSAGLGVTPGAGSLGMPGLQQADVPVGSDASRRRNKARWEQAHSLVSHLLFLLAYGIDIAACVVLGSDGWSQAWWVPNLMFIIVPIVLMGVLLMLHNGWLGICGRYFRTLLGHEAQAILNQQWYTLDWLRMPTSVVFIAIMAMFGSVITIYCVVCCSIAALLCVPLLDASLTMSVLLQPCRLLRCKQRDLLILEQYKTTRYILQLLLQSLPQLVLMALAVAVDQQPDFSLPGSVEATAAVPGHVRGVLIASLVVAAVNLVDKGWLLVQELRVAVAHRTDGSVRGGRKLSRMVQWVHAAGEAVVHDADDDASSAEDDENTVRAEAGHIEWLLGGLSAGQACISRCKDLLSLQGAHRVPYVVKESMLAHMLRSAPNMLVSSPEALSTLREEAEEQLDVHAEAAPTGVATASQPVAPTANGTHRAAETQAAPAAVQSAVNVASRQENGATAALSPPQVVAATASVEPQQAQPRVGHPRRPAVVTAHGVRMVGDGGCCGIFQGWRGARITLVPHFLRPAGSSRLVPAQVLTVVREALARYPHQAITAWSVESPPGQTCLSSIILDGLTRFKSLQQLTICKCDVTDGGFKKVLRQLAAHPALVDLRLSRVAMDTAAAGALADVIKENTRLTSLQLSQVSLPAGGAGNRAVTRLARALRGNRSLMVLTMSRCGITRQGLQAVCNALCTVANTPGASALRYLDVSCNTPMGPTGAQLLCDLLNVFRPAVPSYTNPAVPLQPASGRLGPINTLVAMMGGTAGSARSTKEDATVASAGVKIPVEPGVAVGKQLWGRSASGHGAATTSAAAAAATAAIDGPAASDHVVISIRPEAPSLQHVRPELNHVAANGVHTAANGLVPHRPRQSSVPTVEAESDSEPFTLVVSEACLSAAGVSLLVSHVAKWVIAQQQHQQQQQLQQQQQQQVAVVIHSGMGATVTSSAIPIPGSRTPPLDVWLQRASVGSNAGTASALDYALGGSAPNNLVPVLSTSPQSDPTVVAASDSIVPTLHGVGGAAATGASTSLSNPALNNSTAGLPTSGLLDAELDVILENPPGCFGRPFWWWQKPPSNPVRTSAGHHRTGSLPDRRIVLPSSQPTSPRTRTVTQAAINPLSGPPLPLAMPGNVATSSGFLLSNPLSHPTGIPGSPSSIIDGLGADLKPRGVEPMSLPINIHGGISKAGGGQPDGVIGQDKDSLQPGPEQQPGLSAMKLQPDSGSVTPTPTAAANASGSSRPSIWRRMSRGHKRAQSDTIPSSEALLAAGVVGHVPPGPASTGGADPAGSSRPGVTRRWSLRRLDSGGRSGAASASGNAANVTAGNNADVVGEMDAIASEMRALWQACLPYEQREGLDMGPAGHTPTSPTTVPVSVVAKGTQVTQVRVQGLPIVLVAGPAAKVYGAAGGQGRARGATAGPSTGVTIAGPSGARPPAAYTTHLEQFMPAAPSSNSNGAGEDPTASDAVVPAPATGQDSRRVRGQELLPAHPAPGAQPQQKQLSQDGIQLVVVCDAESNLMPEVQDPQIQAKFTAMAAAGVQFDVDPMPRAVCSAHRWFGAQLAHLELDGMLLGDLGALLCADLVLSAPGLRSLRLPNNRIGDVGAVAVLSAVAHITARRTVASQDPAQPTTVATQAVNSPCSTPHMPATPRQGAGNGVVLPDAGLVAAAAAVGEPSRTTAREDVAQPSSKQATKQLLSQQRSMSRVAHDQAEAAGTAAPEHPFRLLDLSGNRVCDDGAHALTSLVDAIRKDRLALASAAIAAVTAADVVAASHTELVAAQRAQQHNRASSVFSWGGAVQAADIKASEAAVKAAREAAIDAIGRLAACLQRAPLTVFMHSNHYPFSMSSLKQLHDAVTSQDAVIPVLLQPYMQAHSPEPPNFDVSSPPSGFLGADSPGPSSNPLMQSATSSPRVYPGGASSTFFQETATQPPSRRSSGLPSSHSNQMLNALQIGGGGMQVMPSRMACVQLLGMVLQSIQAGPGIAVQLAGPPPGSASTANRTASAGPPAAATHTTGAAATSPHGQNGSIAQYMEGPRGSATAFGSFISPGSFATPASFMRPASGLLASSGAATTSSSEDLSTAGMPAAVAAHNTPALSRLGAGASMFVRHSRAVSALTEGSEGETGCGVCFDNPNNLTIRDCGHKLCVSCYRALVRPEQQSSNTAKCPFCRAPIQGFEYRLGLGSDGQLRL